MSVKNGLLQIYCEDLETSESADEASAGPASSKDHSLLVNWDVLQEKVETLERDNQELREAATERSSELESEEKRELQLIQDVVKQLTDANQQVCFLEEEIARRSEDNIQQQEEITNLLTQVVDLQKKNRELVNERDGFRAAVAIAHECQNELSIELIDVKEKYERPACSLSMSCSRSSSGRIAPLRSTTGRPVTSRPMNHWPPNWNPVRVTSRSSHPSIQIIGTPVTPTCLTHDAKHPIL